jgi:phosphatidylserine synthase
VSLGLFVATAVVLQISNVESAAIRFRKREPFVGLSLMVAALIVVANVLLGGSYGVRGMAIGFCLITVLLTVPMVHRIYAHHIATA